MAFMCSGKKCSFVYSLFVLTSMVAVLWFIWFGTGMLLDKNDVGNDLNKLTEQLTAIGDDYDKNVKVTHGVIDTNGWGVNKRSVISNVNVEVTGKAPGDMMNFTLAFGDVVAAADNYNPKKLLLEISKPINIYQNGNFISSVTFSEPLIYSYLPSQGDGGQLFQHNVILPKKVSLSADSPNPVNSINNGATTGSSEEKFSLNFVNNPVIELVSTGTDDVGSISYDFSGMTITSKEQKILSFGTMKSQFNEEDGDDEGRRSGKYSFVADEVMFYNGEAATKPYSFNVNTNLVFDRNKKKAKPYFDQAPVYNDLNGTDQNREVTVNNMTIANPDFQIRATGNFSNIIGDPLPSGNVDVVIDHLPGFMSSELVAIEGKDLVENGLTKILGQPLTGQDQVSFTLKREKNGVLYVGNTTFEELVASVFSGSIMGTPSTGRYPDIQAPVRTPDNGDTGAGKIDLPSPVQKQ